VILDRITLGGRDSRLQPRLEIVHLSEIEASAIDRVLGAESGLVAEIGPKEGIAPGVTDLVAAIGLEAEIAPVKEIENEQDIEKTVGAMIGLEIEIEGEIAHAVTIEKTEGLRGSEAASVVGMEAEVVMVVEEEEEDEGEDLDLEVVAGVVVKSN